MSLCLLFALPLTMSGSSTGILDFPTEVLIEIFNQDSILPDTLFSLAFACRTFHFIALPIFLGFHPSSTHVSINLRSPGRDMLTVLLTALFTPRTESIHCIFPHPPTCTSIFPHAHLKRLERYISKIPSLNEVLLRFSIVQCGCLSGGGDAFWAWSAPFESLLNCIVRKQCRWLTVERRFKGKCVSEPRLFHLFTGLWRNILRPTAAESQPVPEQSALQEQRVELLPQQPSRHQMSLPRSLGRSSKVHDLTIAGPILLLPPGLNWTLTALRYCPIETLSIHSVVDRAVVWHVVLPLTATAASNVASLHLSDVDFIERLLLHCTIPKLSSLEIAFPFRHDNVSTRQDIDTTLDEISFLIRTLDRQALSPSMVLKVPRDVYTIVDPSSPDPVFQRITTLDIQTNPFEDADIPFMAAWISLFPSVQHIGIFVYPDEDLDEVAGAIQRAVEPTHVCRV
ncbi:hypothetical protein B0H16DRAFT_1475809 [Mycena metata]|uniref:F-box domain-containing protein n=1 Tax=Mycena metata TaxID=1033252 RepID=A0AAD7MI50_9AGAR|nr:hypothetical protein B0H16DRAFT_1475809 [Mycena metata]